MKETCQDGDLPGLATRVQELEDELAQLSYAVSHDVRAPLRAIVGFSDAMLEDFGATLDPAAKRYLERINAAGRRMEAMIQALLAYSRLSKSEITLGPVDLEAAVDEALQAQAAFAQARAAEMLVDRPLPRVVAHRSTLVEALSGLVQNALKFTAEGKRPRVRVRAFGQDGRVRLWVEDEGIGIAPEHHEKIFGVFERLHPPDRYPGIGIGLALARRAVRRLAGQMGVESAPGQGSRFWIDLPAAPPPAR